MTAARGPLWPGPAAPRGRRQQTDRLMLAASRHSPSPIDPEGDPGPCDERQPELERILRAPGVPVKAPHVTAAKRLPPTPGERSAGQPNQPSCGLKGKLSATAETLFQRSQIAGITPLGEEL